jgi:ankyrin repeat domain-containing protein 50
LDSLDKDNPDKQETILMLQWVLFAQRLLKPEELYFAALAGTEAEELGAWNRSNDTPNMIKRYITSTSKGLIKVRKGNTKAVLFGSRKEHTETVQFIHESVNDFLLRNKRLQRLDPPLEQQAIGVSHDRLMACCMSHIMMEELEPLVREPDANELALNYPFLEYAVVYILYHAENASRCIAQQALLERLHLLHREFERLRSFHDAQKVSKYGTGANLLYTVSFHGYYEIVQIVLEKGADVNAQGGEYGNALQAASLQGHDQIVQRLLKKGADVNAKGGEYGNALQAASGAGHNQIVQQLLEKKADINAQGGVYGNALQAASKNGHKAVVALLLEKGVDVNAQGGEYYGNALQAASENGHKAIVALLLDVNAQGGRNGKAASTSQHKAIVALLRKKGAYVNAQGGLFDIALQAASAIGHKAVVALLLEKRAVVNRDALHAASTNGHEAVVALLRAHSFESYNPFSGLDTAVAKARQSSARI